MMNNSNNKIIDNIILANKLKEASQQEYTKKLEQLSEQIVQQVVQPMDRAKMKDSLTKILQEEQANGNTDPVEKILNEQMSNIEQVLQQIKTNLSSAVVSLFSTEFAAFDQIGQTAKNCDQDLDEAWERFKAIEDILGYEWDGTKEVKKNGGSKDDNDGGRDTNSDNNHNGASSGNRTKNNSNGPRAGGQQAIENKNDHHDDNGGDGNNE